jgi:hypothetical protein
MWDTLPWIVQLAIYIVALSVVIPVGIYVLLGLIWLVSLPFRWLAVVARRTEQMQLQNGKTPSRLQSTPGAFSFSARVFFLNAEQREAQRRRALGYDE